MLEYNAMARRMPLKITRIQLQSTRRALPTFSIDDVLNFRAPLNFDLTGTGTAASAKGTHLQSEEALASAELEST